MKTLISVISDITKDIRRSTSLFLVIILGIAAAFSTHLISYGIVEDIAKEKRSYAVYNTISVVGAHSFDQNTYEKITSMPDVKNAFCFFTVRLFRHLYEATGIGDFFWHGEYHFERRGGDFYA